MLKGLRKIDVRSKVEGKMTLQKITFALIALAGAALLRLHFLSYMN